MLWIGKDDYCFKRYVHLCELSKKSVIEGNDVTSALNWLAKEDVAPPSPSPVDDVSILTGETQESKVKVYAAEEPKKCCCAV